jgi:ATP-dependent DNA helicase RecQ
MPTGGGKSLCYQLAALAFQGVTVVVSPLIALMQDQVDALTTRDIPATFLNSTLDHATYVERQQMVRDNRVRLLYVAPETLTRPETINLLQQSKMRLLAIDEAHCISEWGHDFRPEYRQLGDIRSKLPSVPCIALTATATPRVQRDIAECLGIDGAHVYVGDLDRPNLFLEVRHRQDDGVDQVAEFVRSHENQSGIVYCATRAGVDDMCTELNELGIAALPYHAGLDDDVRLQNQKRFVNDDVSVMVATIAFGMGIDKSNIRFVVHANLPDCLDKYYQQIGRSGRDGLRADCLLLHAPRDFYTIRYHVSNMPPEERPGAYHRLDQIQRWMGSAACRRKHLLDYFGQNHASADCGMCDHCVPVTPYQTDTVDLSEYARLFLTCVRQTRERFGRGHIIDVLRGSQSQKIVGWKHDRIAAHGAGRALSAQVWRELADQFIDRGLVDVGKMNVLSVSGPGRKVLDGATFMGKPPSGWSRSRIAKGSIDGKLVEYDTDLFEKLRSLRKSIAGAAGLPPYTVFQDSSLMEMAARYPTTFAEFRDVRGVGDFKTSRYGAQFLAVIRAHCATIEASESSGSETKRPKIRARTREVVACYIETGSLTEAAEHLGIQPGTVAGHLERYVLAGNQIPLAPLMEEVTVSEAQRLEIFALFGSRESYELRPIFEHFDGEISYNDLRMLQVWYLLALQEQKTSIT